jgi:hypothetical protein
MHRAATDKGGRQAAAAALREVRYWRTRRASAAVVKPSADKSQASFGMTVTLRRNDGREPTFRIVGEDEADPLRGTVSYVSPLARAVLTHEPGETVEIAGRKPSNGTCGRKAFRPLSIVCFVDDDRGEQMPNVYVEARPKGRPEGSAIDDYVTEDHADHVLATFKTQREAPKRTFRNHAGSRKKKRPGEALSAAFDQAARQ